MWVLLLLYPFALGIMGRWSKRPYMLFVLLIAVLIIIAFAYVAVLAVVAPDSVAGRMARHRRYISGELVGLAQS